MKENTYPRITPITRIFLSSDFCPLSLASISVISGPSDLILAISGVICAVLTFFEIRSAHRNHVLKKKLRRAYIDMLALYEIEQRLSSAAAEVHLFGSDSAIGTKHIVRVALRIDGMESPSEDCTPHRISQELSKL